MDHSKKKSSSGRRASKKVTNNSRGKGAGQAKTESSRKAQKRKPRAPKKETMTQVVSKVEVPSIILGAVPPVQIVGPSLPFNIDHERLRSVDPAVLERWRSDNLVVHPYPDPKTIEVDTNGFVVGYQSAPEGRSYALRPAEGQIVVPQPVLHTLMQDSLPQLLKSGNVPSQTVLKLISGLKPRGKAGDRFTVPAELLHSLLDLDLPDPLGAKGPGGGGRPVPSPQLAEQVYKQLLKGVPQVGWKDNLVFGVQNGEFLDASKANFYLAVWQMIMLTNHVCAWVEVNGDALKVIAAGMGYGHFAAKANSRGQGVGFTLHPRLELLGKPETIWAIANVGNTPDLRPGFRLHVKDKVSGKEYYTEVVHQKSMRGGMNQTAQTRYDQNVEVVKGNQGLSGVFVGGDWNCFLNTTKDTDPLKQAGYKLVYPNDSTSTQAMGGRLDGLFTYQVAEKVGHYQVINGWKSKLIGRGVTDHGYCRFVIYDTGGPATDGDADSQDVEVVVP